MRLVFDLVTVTRAAATLAVKMNCPLRQVGHLVDRELAVELARGCVDDLPVLQEDLPVGALAGNGKHTGLARDAHELDHVGQRKYRPESPGAPWLLSARARPTRPPPPSSDGLDSSDALGGLPTPLKT